MTESMVERVAQAIEKAASEWRAKQPDPHWRPPEPFFNTIARAAIEAMREPTDEMNDCESIHELMNGPPTRRWQWIWTSLIDEVTK